MPQTKYGLPVSGFRGNLAKSIAGKEGKYGGNSPYTDQDVDRAREYLTEMGKDPDHSIEGRSAAHMLAEFSCFWLKELQFELRTKAFQEANKVITDLQTENAKLRDEYDALGGGRMIKTYMED